jgi:hypothetical protein
VARVGFGFTPAAVTPDHTPLGVLCAETWARTAPPRSDLNRRHLRVDPQRAGSGSQGPPGEQGPSGEQGPPGQGVDGGTGVAPSVSGITPANAFLARSGEVTISGYGTKWTSATTVDFGADITVDKITVASPTALVVNFTVDSTAALGPRDVKVKDGANTESYKGAFSLLSPIALTFRGTSRRAATSSRR